MDVLCVSVWLFTTILSIMSAGYMLIELCEVDETCVVEQEIILYRVLYLLPYIIFAKSGCMQR